MNIENEPTIGSLWQHYNGVIYEVIYLANIDTTDSEKYPETVVYKGVNGKIWTRPLKDWYRSFKQVKEV